MSTKHASESDEEDLSIEIMHVHKIDHSSSPSSSNSGTDRTGTDNLNSSSPLSSSSSQYFNNDEYRFLTPRERIKKYYSSFTSYNNMDFSSVLNDPKDASSTSSPLLSLSMLSSWFSSSSSSSQSNSASNSSKNTLDENGDEIIHGLSAEDYAFIDSLSEKNYESIQVEKKFDSRYRAHKSRKSSSETPLSLAVGNEISLSDFRSYFEMLEKFPNRDDLKKQLSHRSLKAEYFNKIFNTENEAASLLLQEKLSYYLDQVENQVQKQVNYRSSEIFDSMIKYNDLYETLLQSLPLVQELRKRISTYEQGAVLRPLEVANLVRKKQNLNKTIEYLQIIESMHESMEAVKLLVSQRGDLLSALEILSTIDHTFQKSIELSNISCLKHIPKEINIELQVIDETIKQEFAELITEVMSDTESSEWTWSLSSLLTSVLHRDLSSSVMLYTKKHVGTILMELYEKVMSPLKTDVSEDVKLTVSKLEPQQFCDMFESLTKKCLVKLERISEFSQAVDKFCKEANEKTNVNTDKIVVNSVKLKNLNRETQKILLFMNDNIQQYCSTICSAIDNSIIKFPNATLSRYMTIGNSFIDSCDKLCNQKSSILKGKFQSHGQIYLDQFHTIYVQRLKKRLTRDSWESVPSIPEKYQKAALQLLGTATAATVSTFTSSQTTPTKNSSPVPSLLRSDSSPNLAQTPTEDKSSYIVANGIKFKLSTSSLCLLKFISKYCTLLSKEYVFISAVDLHGRILKLMQVYNLELRELVLMAKAREINNAITTITPKHLILASDCIHFLIILVPYIQSKIEDALQEGQKKQLVKFNDFVNDLLEHRISIFEKIISILIEALKAQCDGITNFNWNDKLDQKTQTPFITMIKQTNSVHRTLSSSTFLSSNAMELQKYSTRVYDLLIDKICEAIQKVNTSSTPNLFKTEPVKSRVIADISLIQREITKKTESSSDLPKIEKLNNLIV
ncbi:hypothetical protein C9374_006352 [Naegleria lovaniensis]|uniref:Vacuolar protein sorting-associated protein 54 C-terminal domain-containing protein n=1 Tax=Naegleria lovaniensis TaxID=51637 RepID=A0AA88KJ29_NAELO|nr:uncharacterized protein C9374_006352 [Naegleria lovaniensis]KAG2381363.1 hypothetical protein C9374_006352 [Naegleria lovaniensis]